MSLLDEYKEYISYKRKRNKEREEKQKENEPNALKEFLRDKVENLKMDKHYWEFDYKGFHVSFIMRPDKIAGKTHLVTKSKEENEMLQVVDMIRVENPTLYDKIVNKYKYRRFVINGQPKDSITKLMKHIDKERTQ